MYLFVVVALCAGNSSAERTHHLQPATELQPQPAPGVCLSNKWYVQQRQVWVLALMLGIFSVIFLQVGLFMSSFLQSHIP